MSKDIKQLTLNIPEELHKQLLTIAEGEGVPLSILLRWALIEYRDKYERRAERAEAFKAFEEWSIKRHDT